MIEQLKTRETGWWGTSFLYYWTEINYRSVPDTITGAIVNLHLLLFYIKITENWEKSGQL